MLSFLFHPATTFISGAILALLVASLLLNSCTGTNDSAQLVKDYQDAMLKAGDQGPVAGSAEEKAAISRFTTFLKNLGNSSYIEKETANTYAEGAYLDDTLVTHHGPEEIKKYFLNTAAVGMSQIRFTSSGQVAFHQDFWDSGKNIYGKISGVGGLINIIRNRMK